MNETVTITIPEPPSMNTMLTYKSQWRGKRYYVEQQRYKDEARDMLPEAPESPWRRWGIVAVHFRLWNRRDPLELVAGLKWPVDLLMDEGWVIDDGPDNLMFVPSCPTQEIDRKNRGVDLTLQPLEDDDD